MAPAAADGRARQRPTVGVLEVVGARCRTTSRAGYFSFLGAAHHPSVARLGCRAAGGSPDEWRRGRRGQRRPRRHRRAGAPALERLRWVRRPVGAVAAKGEDAAVAVGAAGPGRRARVLIVAPNGTADHLHHARRRCGTPRGRRTLQRGTRCAPGGGRASSRPFSPERALSVGEIGAPARQARGVVDRCVFGADFTDLGFNGPGRMLFRFNLP
jgi:hypothetical protein